MTERFARSLSGALALALACAGAAAAPVPSVTVQGMRSVEIGGHVEREFRAYSHYWHGIDEFENSHAFAPRARLKFWLHSLANGDILDSVRVQIEAGDYVVPLPLAADGTFEVPIDPKALESHADVVVNRYKVERIMWGLVVRTPGLPDDAYRLGDLRLECHAYQAINRYRRFVKRSGIVRICDQPDRLWINFEPRGAVRGFSLSYRDERVVVDGGLNRPYTGGIEVGLKPRADGAPAWPDDTLLRFIPADPPPAAPDRPAGLSADAPGGAAPTAPPPPVPAPR